MFAVFSANPDNIIALVVPSRLLFHLDLIKHQHLVNNLTWTGFDHIFDNGCASDCIRNNIF